MRASIEFLSVSKIARLMFIYAIFPRKKRFIAVEIYYTLNVDFDHIVMLRRCKSNVPSMNILTMLITEFVSAA